MSAQAYEGDDIVLLEIILKFWTYMNAVAIQNEHASRPLSLAHSILVEVIGPFKTEIIVDLVVIAQCNSPIG